MAGRKVKRYNIEITETQVKAPEFNTDKDYYDFIDKLFNKDDMQLEHFDEYDDDGNKIEEKDNWKDVALDIKKFPIVKFNDVKDIPFCEIHSKIKTKNGFEAYTDAYSELSFYVYCYQRHNKIHPFTYRFEDFNVTTFIKNLFKRGNIPSDAYVKTTSQDSSEARITSLFIGFTEKLWLYIDASDKGIIYYAAEDEKDPASFFYTLMGLLRTVKRPKVPKNKINIVYRNMHGFDKVGFTVKKLNIDLNDNYNDEFPEMADKIIDGLNRKDKTNLVILSGEPGTGKTTFIRYLTSRLKKNIIFISPDMVDSITDPAFIPFLMSNNDSVLIIEDAEPALEKRNQGGRTSAVSNVLNLTDGLLSDCLKISIVATFNTKEGNIDEALTRKGRLLMNYKFEKLSIEKSKILLEKNGHTEVEVKEPMTLADIYFYGTDNNIKKPSKKIGFGNRD